MFPYYGLPRPEEISPTGYKADYLTFWENTNDGSFYQQMSKDRENPDWVEMEIVTTIREKKKA